jgi:hypothetical protein
VTDLLRQASQWLAGMLKGHAAGPVTYSRASESVEVWATLGRTQYEIQDDYGLRVGASMIDFLIARSDLAATFDEPRPGDRITVDGKVHEVLALSGQGCWRWSDPYRVTMRIHTREIAEAIDP